MRYVRIRPWTSPNSIIPDYRPMDDIFDAINELKLKHPEFDYDVAERLKGFQASSASSIVSRPWN